MNTTRREFLLVSGKGMVLTAALPLLNACSALERADLNQKVNTVAPDKILSRDHYEILRYASLAPSSHNTQPWEVEIISPGQWKIKSNPRCRLPGVDPANREGVLSIGAFIENLVLAAGSFGYEAETEYLADSLKSKTIARVNLKKNRRIESPLHKIALRRTVRSNHLKKQIRAEDIKFITGNDADFHFFSAQSAAGRLLAEKTLEANRIQSFRNQAQNELAEWIRWSDADARKFRNGLTPASMEISGFASLFVRMFYDKDKVMTKSFREKGIEMVKNQVNCCSGWMVITGGSDAKNLIETGRKFQRMLLKTREKMIAVHPMTQLLEEGFENRIQSALGISAPVQFVLRTSYLEKYPEPVSLRRPVEWFAI